MSYLLSSQVKVYPSSKRNDAYDRNARLNSEQNLVSVVNRLTSRKCFIVDGLNISQSGNTLTIGAGSFNIYGYLFNIPENIELDLSSEEYKSITVNSVATSSDNTIRNYLYFAIKLRETTLTPTVVTSEQISVSFNELVAFDNTIIADTNSPNNSLDGTSNSKLYFYGLSLVANNESDLNNRYVQSVSTSSTDEKTWYLLIAKSNGSNWAPVVSDDGVSTDSSNNFIHKTMNASDILIDANDSSVANDKYSNPQDLSTWLQYNFIIDDGKIFFD